MHDLLYREHHNLDKLKNITLDKLELDKLLAYVCKIK